MPTNTTKPKKLVISSLTQYANLAARFPDLLNFSSFGAIRDVIQRLSNIKGCKCNAKADIINYRPQFETAMLLLTKEEQQRAIAILGVETLCFYTRDNGGRLKEICYQ